MVEQEKNLEDSFKLSIEELTCPETGKEPWFEQLVARQQEGIKMGFRPQNPRGLGLSRRRTWRARVWNPYFAKPSFSEEERRVIARTREPGQEKHTGPSRYNISRLRS